MSLSTIIVAINAQLLRSERLSILTPTKWLLLSFKWTMKIALMYIRWE
jgi:hypothetical protein